MKSILVSIAYLAVVVVISGCNGARVKELESQVSAFENQVSELESKVAEFESQLEEVQSALSTAESDAENLTSAIEDLDIALQGFSFMEWQTVVLGVRLAVGQVESAAKSVESSVDAAISSAN